LTQHSPPAFVATLPPIVDQGALAGSGGYQSPSFAAAARRSSLTTPGWTTARRSAGSISRISRIRSVESTTHPSTAFAPPESPVPAPRGTTGMPCRAQAATTAATSAVDSGRATASAPP
jgi:hypothetical protein